MILYFIPKNSTAKAPEHCTTQRDVQGGPGGHSGVIYTNGTGKTGYYPNEQTWVAVADADSENNSYWLGVDGDPVTPADLERDELIDGHHVILEDGNDWLIPTLRCVPSGSNLPEALILGPNGELVRKQLPRFASYYKDAEQIYAVYIDGEEILWQDAWDIAVKVLSLNYHLGRHEVSLLVLITDTILHDILKAVIDYPAMIAAVDAAKKKEAQLQDSDSLNAGSGA